MQRVALTMSLVALCSHPDGGFAVESVLCYRVCECQAPTVLCNLTLTRSRIPVFTAISGYTALKLYGNKDVLSIPHNTFPSSWSINNLEIHGINISDTFCTAFDGLKNYLRYLSLERNNFNKFPLCLIGRFTELTGLHLKHNSIRRLSSGDIINNPDLQVLDLSFNIIESIHPRAIQSTRNLNRLILSHNKLKVLKAEQFKLLKARYLYYLDLSHNEIGVLSEEMFSGIATSLKGLDVSFNKITAKTWPSSVMALQSLTGLKSLNVSGHSLNNLDARQFNGSLRSLDSLTIAQCSLRDFSWEAFATTGHLNVSGNNIVSRHLQIHRAATTCGLRRSSSSGCPQIDIDVSGNHVSEMVILRDFTFGSKPMKIVAKNNQLKNLTIYLNNTSPNFPTTTRPKLTLILSENELLRPVVLYINPLTNNTNYTYIQEIALDLSDNKLGQVPDKPLRAFVADFDQLSDAEEVPTCDLLRKTIGVYELDLSGNNITTVPAESCLIAQIKVLKLNRNQIKSLGRLMWTGGSAGCNQLEELELRQNGLHIIEPNTFEGLVKLRTVDLRDNELSTVEDLSYLGTLSTFRILQLDNNPLNCNCILLWFQQNYSFIIGQKSLAAASCWHGLLQFACYILT